MPYLRERQKKQPLSCQTAVRSEAEEQIAFMDWVRLQPDLAPYVIHIANQRRANLIYGRRLKRMGVKAGVSDIFVAIPCHGRHGLWIEFKVRGGKLTSQQTNWLSIMIGKGYEAIVAYGADMAISALEKYLGRG